MAPEPPLDAEIDRLYQLPLDQFVEARNVLAKQVSGEERRTVRALAKPNTVAWALNQVYWSARPAFDRLMTAAGHLREAQAAALLGRPADLRAASAAHRQAVDAAIGQATKLLEAAGHDANPDTLRSLMAAFDALPWEEPGRLVKPPSPTGFAAFAGMPTAPITEGPPETAPETAAAVEKEETEAEPLVGREPERALPRREAEREAGAGRAARAGAQGAEREAQRQAELREQREAALREEREAELREQRELEARRQRMRNAVEEAKRHAAAAAERQRTADAMLAGAREAERAAREQLEAARRGVKDAEVAYRQAEREASSADAAVRKAEAAPQPTDADSTRQSFRPSSRASRATSGAATARAGSPARGKSSGEPAHKTNSTSSRGALSLVKATKGRRK